MDGLLALLVNHLRKLKAVSQYRPHLDLHSVAKKQQESRTASTLSLIALDSMACRDSVISDFKFSAAVGADLVPLSRVFLQSLWSIICASAINIHLVQGESFENSNHCRNSNPSEGS